MSDSIPYQLGGRQAGRTATFVDENIKGESVSKELKEGSLASNMAPPGGTPTELNVVKDYPWTLSNVTNDVLAEVPYIRLIEYKRLEGSLKLQASFYTSLIPKTAGNAVGKNSKSRSVLDPYKELWPKDNPTNWIYKFPYFNKKGFDLSTSWDNIGEGGEAVKKLISGSAGMVMGSDFAKGTQKVLNAIQKLGEAKQAYDYPSAGAKDRPKVFSNHGERSIDVSFTLYNTKDPNDWLDNRDLVYLLMNQNLFNKRDLTTGIPPVWYEVWIPGQYYSYASCISNINVEYLGNQRLLYYEYIVPDAYQVNLTLTELVQPSKNQLEAVTSGMARNKVKVAVDTNTGTETFGFERFS